MYSLDIAIIDAVEYTCTVEQKPLGSSNVFILRALVQGMYLTEMKSRFLEGIYLLEHPLLLNDIFSIYRAAFILFCVILSLIISCCNVDDKPYGDWLATIIGFHQLK